LVEGRRALVTGGGSGIGAAVCDRLHREGATVAVLDRRADAAAAVAGRSGGVAVVADVRRAEEVEAAVSEAVATLGGLDLVVCSAGVGALAPLEAYDEALWDRLVDVNLKGTWLTLRATVGHLRAAGGGTVVLVGSVSGHRPTRGEVPYSAAKAGVSALAAGAALELGPAIRVNCVSPGFIDTPLTRPALEHPGAEAALAEGTPLGRAGRADEVADAVLYLSSSWSSYVTGHDLVVDGGSLLPGLQTHALLGALLDPP
jgi:NAD(P)-dependent dehydrogenase (short-subunit alcohol dehydrogenase family)